MKLYTETSPLCIFCFANSLVTHPNFMKFGEFSLNLCGTNIFFFEIRTGFCSVNTFFDQVLQIKNKMIWFSFYIVFSYVLFYVSCCQYNFSHNTFTVDTVVINSYILVGCKKAIVLDY